MTSIKSTKLPDWSKNWFTTAILVLILSIICFNPYQYCEGKRLCYICNTVIDGKDCLDNPDNITGTTPENPGPCRHFCTIKRKEFLNIPGEWIVISLERNCEERPFMLDGVEGENHTMTYYRSCRANLCNDGDGVGSLKYIPEEPDEPEEEISTSSSPPRNYRWASLVIFKIHFFAYISSIT